MLKMLSYLLKQGIATSSTICPPLEETARGLPHVTSSPCMGEECNACAPICPTTAIEVKDGTKPTVRLDLGACIACGLCTAVCPTETIVENLSTQVARSKRSDLILTNSDEQPASKTKAEHPKPIATAFKRSIHARVVSTGCSACDLEIGASTNPVFDVERFGVQIVASPRAADVLMVTGPVAKGMQTAVIRCYEAMPDPKMVIAVGSCAISGGVHKGGYTEANGLDSILPVDVYIPGCPPHPWSVIHGIMTARDASKARELKEKKRAQPVFNAS